MVIPIYIIKRTGKIPNNERYKKEHDRQNKRRQKNAELFDKVKNTLDSYYNQPFKFKDAIKLANSIAEKIDVKIDRDARRSKDTLICWFCENWTLIQQIFNQTQNTTPQVNTYNNTNDDNTFCSFDENDEDANSFLFEVF